MNKRLRNRMKRKARRKRAKKFRAEELSLYDFMDYVESLISMDFRGLDPRRK